MGLNIFLGPLGLVALVSHTKSNWFRQGEDGHLFTALKRFIREGAYYGPGAGRVWGTVGAVPAAVDGMIQRLSVVVVKNGLHMSNDS